MHSDLLGYLLVIFLFTSVPIDFDVNYGNEYSQSNVFDSCRWDLTLSTLLEWIIKTGKSGKMRRLLSLYGRVPSLLVHLHG